MAVDAVRVVPGQFFLASDEIEEGMEFAVRDTIYRIVEPPCLTGYKYGWAKVQVLNGKHEGTEFDAELACRRRGELVRLLPRAVRVHAHHGGLNGGRGSAGLDLLIRCDPLPDNLTEDQFATAVRARL
jgi:hypothetical protein